MVRRAWCAFILAPALAACRSPTQIEVTVDTDVPCSDVKGTSFRVGELGSLENALESSESTACSGMHLGSVVLIPSGSNDALVGFKVVTSLNDKDLDYCASDAGVGDHDCIVARRALRYLPHTPLEVRVTMEAACEGVVCDPASTCVRGGCVPATIADPTKCEGVGCDDTALADAGVDATVGADGGEEGDGAIDGPGNGGPDGSSDGSSETGTVVPAGDAGYSPPTDCDLGGTEPRAAWPEEGYCGTHRNRSPYRATHGSSVALSKPSIAFDGPNDIRAPAMTANGTLVVTSQGATVQAFNPDLSLKWRYVDPASDAGSDGPLFMDMPVVAADGTIRVYDDNLGLYVVLDATTGALLSRTTHTSRSSAGLMRATGALEYIVNDDNSSLEAHVDGGLIWVGPGADNHAFPTIAADHTIVTTSNGYLSRTLTDGGGAAPTLVASETLAGLELGLDASVHAYTSTSNVLFAYDPATFATLWSAPFDASVSELVGYSIGDDGTTYVGTQSNGLVRVDVGGHKTLSSRFKRCGPPVIDPVGTLVVWCDGQVVAVSSDLSTTYWAVTLPGPNSYVLETPVIAPNGAVYFTLRIEPSTGSDTFALYAVGP